MARRIGRKWLIAATVLIAGVALLVLAGSRAVRGPYPFLSEFGGEEKAGFEYGFAGLAGKPFDDGKLCYQFHASLSEVLPVMTRDLTAAGWKLVYKDAEYAAFTRIAGKDTEIADLQPCYSSTMPSHEAPPTESCATLPQVPKTWFADRVEALLNYIHKRTPKGFVEAHDLVAGFPGVDSKDVSSNGTAVVKVTWSNRSPVPSTGTLEECCLRGYEPDQPLPLKTNLDPWQIKVIELTYPAAAAEGEPKDRQEAVGGEYSFSSSSASGSGGFGASAPVAPLIGTSDSGTKTALTIENDNAWAISIKGLTIKLNGVTKLAKPEVLTIGPGKELRIPMPFYRRGKSPEAVIAGSYRLAQNRRWHTFGNKPDNGMPPVSDLP